MCYLMIQWQQYSLNLFSLDTEAAVGVVLWKKCFYRNKPTVGSLFQ